MTTRANTLRRLLVAAATAVVLAALAASSAPAQAPPEAGTTGHGFLVDAGVITTIDHPDAPTIPALPDGQAGTLTVGINDRGEVVGVYGDTELFTRKFVRDRRGRFTLIDDPPSGSAYEIVDINNRGEITGFYNDAQGTTTGFLRTKKGRFKTLEVPGSQVTAAFRINDRREVVGWYQDAGGVMHGFLWDGGDFETIDVTGAVATALFGINNRGQMVGFYVDDAGAGHGFLRDRKGHVTVLPHAPGVDPTVERTVPSSINDRGRIVGGVVDARGRSRGFLLERRVFTMIDGAPDAVYTRALDINNRGHIVGDYATRPPTGMSS